MPTKVNDEFHSRNIYGAMDGKETIPPAERVVGAEGWAQGLPRAALCLSLPTTSSLSWDPTAHVQQGHDELFPKEGTSFPRHLVKPLDHNSPVTSWLLSPAFLLFIMLDRKPMQMLYFGKMPGRTKTTPAPPPPPPHAAGS